MKFLLTFLTLLCAVAHSTGQPYLVKGSVSDTLNAVRLHRASAVLIRTTDSVIETFTRTSKAGTFELQVPATGKYILRITFPSFADYVEIVNVQSNTTDVGEIAMVSKENLLKEFVLTKQFAAIKVKGDTTEYMADSFKVKENANVEDLLKRLPGIQVDKNGQITAQGQTVQKILVDGEEFFSDDPKVVTQGLQANAVDKVQVFDKKSDQAEFTGIDDGEKTKTINLKLKENKKKGFFGKADVGGGTDGYFQNQGMINAFRGKRQFSAFGIVSNTDKVGLGWDDNGKFGGGGGITEITDDGSWMISGSSYDDFGGWSGKYSGQGLPKVWTGGLHFANKWDEDKQHVGASYRHAIQNVEIDGSNITQYSLTGDTTRVNNEHKSQFNTTERNGFDGFYEWKIDTNTSIRLTTSGNTKDSRSSTMYHTESYVTTPEQGPKSINDRNFANNTKALSEYADLLVRKKFAKKGRTVSLDINENYSDSKSTGKLNSSLSIPNLPTTNIDQQKINNTSTLSLQSKATYTEPLSKVAFAEINYAFSANNSTALATSNDKEPGGNDYSRFVDSLSSDYKYNIVGNSAGLNFKFVYKKLNFGFGTDVSKTDYRQTDVLHGDTTREYSYNNLFPKANFQYKFSKQTSLRFTYQGSTKQPTITQIQPLRQNSDPLNITLGNTSLKQQFTNKFNLNFNDYRTLSHRYFWSGVTLNAVGDAISTAQVTNGPVSTAQYVNVSGNYSTSGYIGYNFKLLKPYLDMDISGDINQSHQNSYINDKKNIGENNSYSFGPGFSYQKDEKFEFRLDPTATYNDNHSTVNSFSTNYWVFDTKLKAEVQLPKKFEVGSDADVMMRQKTVVFTSNNNIVKWNAYVTKKFLKKSELAVKVAIYDILNQNIGYSRTATGNTISQNSYNTIRRYAMLSLVWNFTHNQAGATSSETN